MSPREEAELGKELLPQIKAELPLVADSAIAGYVNTVGNAILEHVGRRFFSYEFFVVDSSSMNAFAIPGGYIFIFRGLIEVMDTESEMAAVLAHEIGHVQARHIARRIEETTPLNIATLAGALLAVLVAGTDKAASAIVTSALAVNTTMALKFSRQNEEEADRQGMRYLADAGYDVEGMVSVFKKMIRNQFLDEAGVATYLSTHPGLSDRVVYMENQISAHEYPAPPEKGPGYESDFLYHKVRLIALYDDPHPGMNKLAHIARTRGGALPHYGMGLLLERGKRMHEAIREYEKAVRLAPKEARYYKQLGKACYALGDCGDAEVYLNKALLLDPHEQDAMFHLGRIYTDQGKYEDAKRVLLELKKRDPDRTEVYQYLGLAYGRNNELGPAHEYYGIYFERSNDRQNARYHYDKALEYYKGNPGKEAEIRKRVDALDPQRKKQREDRP